MTNIEKTIREIVASECCKNSTCFDDKGKEVDCINDCDFVRRIAERIKGLRKD